MDINSMFANQALITKFINNLRVSSWYNGIEKELMEPVVEQLVSLYNGVPEVQYNPAEDTSGTDYLELMLFSETPKMRKFAYRVVMLRLQTLLADASGIVSLDIQDKTREIVDMSARDAFNKYRDLGANVMQIVRLLNNMCVVVYPIITEYAENE